MHRLYFQMICLLLALGLAACGAQPGGANEGMKPLAENDPSQGELLDARLSGLWCYDYQDSALHLTAVLDHDGFHNVKGNFYADIHDTVQRYWSYYTGEFEGKFDGPDLAVTSRTELEGVTTERKEVWNWSMDGKTLRGHEGRLMKWVDCELGAE